MLLREDNTYDLPRGDDIFDGLRRWFDRQRKEVLGTIKELGDALPETMPSLDGWNERMGESFTPMIGAYWEESARETYERLGTDPDRWQVVNEQLKPAIRRLALNFCESTNATTTATLADALADLRESLVQGLVEEGESVRELTRRVGAIFEDAEEWKARQIAVTESSRAVHAAQLEADHDSGVVAGLELLLSDDACPLCRMIHDECPRVPLGRNFAKIGDHPSYSEIKFPPLHPACQCTVIEVLLPEYGGPADVKWGETLIDPKPDPDA